MSSVIHYMPGQKITVEESVATSLSLQKAIAAPTGSSGMMLVHVLPGHRERYLNPRWIIAIDPQ